MGHPLADSAPSVEGLAWLVASIQMKGHLGMGYCSEELLGPLELELEFGLVLLELLELLELDSVLAQQALLEPVQWFVPVLRAADL